MFVKRVFDIIFSSLLLVLLSPVLAIISFIIRIDSKGPVFFKQSRVGKNNEDFTIFKFRTMTANDEDKSLLTIGNDDSRITIFGNFLRKYKLDELPQLINILIGNMSFVGPRPELRYYVNQYPESDLVVLKVKPGVTGLASLKYRHEAELLKASKNPERFYIQTIMPDKLKLNKDYIGNRSFFLDLKILFQTLLKVVFE